MIKTIVNLSTHLEIAFLVIQAHWKLALYVICRLYLKNITIWDTQTTHYDSRSFVIW